MDELTQLIRESIEYYLTDVHTAIFGVVEKYDANTRRADIRPSLKRKMPGGKFLEFPIIPDVPVRYSGNKEFTIHFPLKKGDEVLLIIAERGTDTWKASGGKEIEENDPRRFDIQDCIAITGNAPKDFIVVKEEGLNIVHHKKEPKGEWISTITMDDDKIRLKYKDKSQVLMEDDKIECTTEKNKVTMTNQNIDVVSPNPVGINGTSTKLGGDVLQVFWDDLAKAWNQYPVIIPPVPLPPGAPVPPAPPLINMALNGIKNEILAAITKAKQSCAKAIK